jgi:hypothetical protein
MADEAQKELSFGEKAVGLSFNPSGDPTVVTLKQQAAAFIDSCHEAQAVAEDPEVKRMYALAITELQVAQMWSVKAATWTSSPAAAASTPPAQS